MRGYVLDASALLALVNQEPGDERVRGCLKDGAIISAVNLSEVVAKLSEKGMPETVIHEVLDVLDIMIINFDSVLAYKAGLLRPLTKSAGLSLGDRTCLALAQQLKLPAATTDRAWKSLPVNVIVEVIR